MPENNFIMMLNDTTRVIVYFSNDKKNILRFVVKLEIFLNGNWIEIERYDTHHGSVHKDIIDKSGNKKRSIYYELVDIDSGLNMAIKDFKENYQIYIWRFLND
jgi:hypothetical protein